MRYSPQAEKISGGGSEIILPFNFKKFESGFFQKNNYPMKFYIIEVMSPPIPQCNIHFWILYLATNKQNSPADDISDYKIEIGGYRGK